MPTDSPLFEFLHQAQMTNAVTGYCTCMAGIMPLLWTFLSRPQPIRWIFVYFCILLTGIPTVLFHANEANELLGTLDTGSNVFLTWAIQIAVAGDFMKSANKMKFIIGTTLVNGIAWTYMGYHTLQGNPRPVMIDMPPIFFTVEEVMLIVNAFLVVGLLFSNYSRIPVVARKTLLLVFFMFLGGLMLASAKSDAVPYRVFPLHAIWHILGAFALTSLWAFNHLRFSEPVPILPHADETTN